MRLGSPHANQAAKPDRLPLPRELTGARGAVTILVVEDEDFVREVTCEVLEFEGYQVLKARSAVEAMRIFHRSGEKVQLLLTDVVLPGRSGRELAHTLHGEYPGLRTIFVSGYPENDAMQKELPGEEAFYLPKPFSVESLMRMVKQVLKKNGGEAEEGETNGESAEKEEI